MVMGDRIPAGNAAVDAEVQADEAHRRAQWADAMAGGPHPVQDAVDRDVMQDGLPWAPLLQDLIELDRAGALGGIRAIVAERLVMVCGTMPDRPCADDRERLVYSAALTAAEIDRLEAGR